MVVIREYDPPWDTALYISAWSYNIWVTGVLEGCAKDKASWFNVSEPEVLDTVLISVFSSPYFPISIRSSVENPALFSTDVDVSVAAVSAIEYVFCGPSSG